MPRHNITKILFDIKPVDETGQVDVKKIEAVFSKLDLKKQRTSLYNFARNRKAPTDAASNKLVNSVGAAYSTVVRARQLGSSISERAGKSSTYVDIPDSVENTGFAPVGSWLTNPNRYYTLPTIKQSYQEKLISQGELEKFLNADLEIKNEIKSFGGETIQQIFVNQKSGISKAKFLISKQSLRQSLSPNLQIKNTKNEDFDSNPKNQEPENSEKYQTVLDKINEKILQRSEELVGESKKTDPFEFWDNRSLATLTTSDVYGTSDVRSSSEIESWVRYIQREAKEKKYYLNWKKFLAVVVAIGFVVLISAIFSRYGASIKSEIIKEGNSAMASLEQANRNLQVFDFETASDDFTSAYEKFSKAGDNLGLMGASFTSLLIELPGFDKLTAGGANKLKSAKNLVEAGRLLAEAGKSMSEAVNSLSKTAAILNVEGVNVEGAPLQSSPVGNLKKSLLSSSRNLTKAEALLSDVSPDVLPEDKKKAFREFQSKLPEFEKLVSDGIGYVDFLEGFIGFEGKTRKYLILFQNDSELRPTGGFPGTYAVVTFEDGRLKEFFVNDIYNLDGQIKEDIIPPKPLQHITPTWGMRDANWFIDFSVSAQKVMEFFKDEAGYEVDGVITIGPSTIAEILQLVGPIEMPEYGFTVDAGNFLSIIQEEVEYGDNRQQPKTVVVDLASKLLERIRLSDAGQWADIFNVFLSGLDRKDILMYFKNLSLEDFAAEKNFGGLVKENNGDYLMVTFSNVKGSKTDKVTDNYIKLDLQPQSITHNQQQAIKHKLTIIRQHNGGSTKYGFYNKQNPAYVRVLVPEGSELISISGNSKPDFKPLVNYSNGDFKVDGDLQKLEAGFRFDEESGVSVYKESGKTGFAFWLITDPGERKTIELEYIVPITDTSCRYTDMTCRDAIYIQKQPGLEVDNFELKVGTFDELSAGSAYIYNGGLEKDLEFKIDN